MKKSGFTLAEVLITLGIIGVVAALTAPALVMQSRNQANASRLAVIVSELENAFTTAIATENAEDLTKTSLFVKTVTSEYGTNPETGETTLDKVTRDAAAMKKFAGNLKKYLYTSGFQVSNGGAKDYYSSGPYAMNESGQRSTNMHDYTQLTRFFPILLKNGGVVFFAFERQDKSGARDVIADAGGGLYDSIGTAVIDVNGVNEPNTFGRDIFEFAIGKDGILYPFGGIDYSIFVTTTFSGGQATAGNDTKTWKKGNLCPKWGSFCAGRVIEEGYKITY